ncbi:MAG TPA: N-acetylmuramoyl-L-alanine amidase [Bacillota bacterium]
MVKIFIDPGHGGHDGGAAANGLKEKDLTLKIAKKVRSRLGNYEGASTKMSRTTDKYVSLTGRTNMANSWNADFFLSIHINAGGGTGYEDYIYSGLSSMSRAGSIHDEINKAVVSETGWRNRGKKKANFAVLRQSNMPAVLTESGFIDTKSDADKLKSDAFLNKIADGHVKGIARYFGLKKKDGDGSDGGSKKVHVVKKGDTLWSIAQQYGTTVSKLKELNPGIDSNRLQIGQKIRVK